MWRIKVSTTWCWESSRAGGEGAKNDEVIRWHHWLNGCEFEQTLGASEGQRSLVCCSPWDHKELDTISDWTTTKLVDKRLSMETWWIHSTPKAIRDGKPASLQLYRLGKATLASVPPKIAKECLKVCLGHLFLINAVLVPKCFKNTLPEKGNHIKIDL